MKILITAGPTYERIDPVRFIGNYSTGKMGFAIARACADAGHEVLLIAGPVQLAVSHPNIRRIDVESADDMYRAVMDNFASVDGALLCAAVADFTPIAVASRKIKRLSDNLVIELRPTQDIAAAVGACKRPDQFTVGFALETNDEESHALEKMRRKKFDFIVLNSLRNANTCFGYDTNQIEILKASGEKLTYPLKSKDLVAKDILDEVEKIVASIKH